MTNVLAFPPRHDDPHAQGTAVCIGCGYRWQAVAPVGTVRLACPQCATMTGTWLYECAPPPGQPVRVCDCGNDLFRITPDGHLCARCGTYQRY